MTTLRQSILDIHSISPDVPVILDCKDMDIGNTNVGYVKMAFDYCQADAITVNPYLGGEAAQPFLDMDDKGIFVLCRTSNVGSNEFQEFQGVDVADDTDNFVPLYKYVASRVASHWNKNNNCGLVVGANHPEELHEVRGIVGDMPILIPGVGAQGGDIEQVVKAGKNSKDQGMIINLSRSVIFASNGLDFAEAARAETLRVNTLIHKFL
jgi:orotidine-5'-phosphate decarboxylase